MRVLTKIELKAFEQAFSFIERVCIVGHETDYIYNIKVLNKGQANSLPSKVYEIISKFKGLKKASYSFNSFSKTETLPKFIDHLMKNKEQPREYFALGTLVLDDIQVQTMTYEEDAS